MKSLLLLFGFMICSPLPILAQSSSTTASIVGIVKDPQDASIAGATITVKQKETNLTRNFKTGEQGTFQLVQLPSGNYEMTINAPGYNLLKKSITLTLGTTLVSEIKLILASTTNEVIEITSDNIFSEFKTESSNTNSQNRIAGLPINRRDFLDFSLTSPRVTPDRVSNQGVLSTSGLSFNGQSGRFNNITIDGLDNNDFNQGAVRATFSQEAVQEFQVISDNYSAEFGRALSGIVNIVTKGGSNDFHASLFFLNRNDSISARNSFDSSKAPYSQYQFGTTVGGPIKKDKAFLFTSFERSSIKQNNIVTISDETVAAGHNLGYPLNNGAEPFSIGTTFFLARSDIQINANDNIWVRYNSSFGYNGGYEPFGALTDITSSGIFRVKDHSIAFNNTYINSRLNLVNETRFLYSRRNQNTLAINTDAGVQVTTPKGRSLFGHTAFLPEFNSQRIYQIVDNVSFTQGKNQVKFGIDFFHRNRPPQTVSGILPDGFGVFSTFDFATLFGTPGLPVLSGLQSLDPKLRTPQQRAFLTFLSSILPTTTPNFPKNINLADLSLPLVYLQGFGDSNIEINSKLFSAFAQDDIRLKQNLRLNLGVRYDINRIDFTPNNNGNFSPRIGISYQPKKIPRLNLHASYGLFFSVPFIRFTLSSQASNLGRKLLFVPFPLSVLPFSLPGHKIPNQNQLPTGITFVPQFNLINQYAPKTNSDYTQQINAAFDWLLTSNTVVLITYNYVRGIRLLSVRDINPVVNAIPSNPLASMLVGRVDPSKGDIIEIESAFDSYYHAFTLSINRRFTDRINFFANYTFSKGIDNTIDFNASVTDRQNNSLTPGAERGYSVQDTRNRFILSGIWELSYTKNRFLRDFQLATIISANSGRPYNLIAGVDLNMDGDGGLSDRPTGLGRNVGITPGFANIDVRLTRKIKFKSKYELQGFIEAFNLFNRVNIDPNSIDRTFPPDAQGNFHLPPQENGRYIVTPDRFRGSFSSRQFQFGFHVSF